jgi:hypothetical protein
MRYGVLFMLSIVALLAFSPLYAEEPKGADIEFKEKVIDLGLLAQDDDKQELRVSFRNTGDVPFVVTEVRTSCSCTTIKYDRKPVQPGESGVLNITVDPKKAPKGHFYRVLQVYSSARGGVKHITLKAVISN